MAPLSRTHRATVGAVAVAALAVLGLTTGTAQAGPVGKAPQLSIAVDNGAKATRKGDRLAYTVTVTNLGSSPVKDLVITQDVPAGATFVSAGQDGGQRSGTVTWRLDLGATKAATLHSVMTVAATPDSLLRLATVSCAKTSPKAAPIVCATDSDLLPAGAAAAKATAATTATGTTGFWSSPSSRYAGGGVALAVAAAALWWAARRRRA